MTFTDWIANLRAAGVTRVSLDIAPPVAGPRGHLPLDFPQGSFPQDQAPHVAADVNAQAESDSAQTAETAEEQARALELAHLADS